MGEEEKEIRQKKRGDAWWMRFHRGGRRDAARALLEKVSGAAEKKHAEDANHVGERSNAGWTGWE